MRGDESESERLTFLVGRLGVLVVTIVGDFFLAFDYFLFGGVVVVVFGAFGLFVSARREIRLVWFDCGVEMAIERRSGLN